MASTQLTIVRAEPLVPNGFGRFRKDRLAPSGCVAPVFVAGTINLDQAVNRTVRRACEAALVSHNKIETLG
jgi:hypothetical protein